MKAVILDEFNESNSICYLSKVSLKDYIESLPSDYKDYEVQREIVNNAYLDNLISTILSKRHIPPIVLVIENGEFELEHGELDINNFKILDGLQRTFRLKSIYDTIELLIDELTHGLEILDFSRIKLAVNFKEKLEKINSSSSLLSKLLNFYKQNLPNNIDALTSLYNRNQWFEIWTGLSPEDEVNKMLILNAGHKAVKTKHQLELLFRYILPLLEKIDINNFKVIREKEVSTLKLGKDRSPGQFLFSHLITSLLSFSEAKPLTTNIDLIQKSQTDFYNDDLFEQLLQFNFLKEFITTLTTLDLNLANKFQSVGTQWLGRETSLVGIFAAIGKFSKEESIDPIDALSLFNAKITEHVEILNLKEFERVRNSQDLAKINFGLINKRAVSTGVYSILKADSDSIVWDIYFKGAE